jgi:DNA-binding MarR family transcriptional regulator
VTVARAGPSGYLYLVARPFSRPRRSYQAAAAFRAALARFGRRTEEICRRHGLSVDQYTLLLLVKGSEDGREATTVTRLAERLQLAPNGVTERVGRAEDAGLLVRERSPADARVSLIRLSADGERRLARAFAELGEESDRVFEVAAALERREWLPERARRGA